MTPLTGEQLLERGLGDRVEMTTRPRPTPREVFAAWLGNFGVGVGTGVVWAVALYLTGAPGEWLFTVSLSAGAVAFGGMMIWHGSIDERADWRNVRQVRKSIKLIAQEYASRDKRLQAQLEAALDAIDEADAEIQQLRRSLDEMARQRDRAVYDLTREREHVAQRSNGRSLFVAPVAIAPEDVRDATELIRYRYDTGAHLSRRKAVDMKGWSERRWDTAKVHLDAAGVIRIVKGQTEYPQILDEALEIFGEYLLHTVQLSVPTINMTLGKTHYVESDEG